MGLYYGEIAMYRFRITDGATHAEEFSADSLPRFCREILDAFRRFRACRTGRDWLRLHAWDGDWWVDVRNRRMRPISLTERDVFGDAAQLWSHAERSAWGAMHMNSQMGALREFLRMSPDERRAYRRKHLNLIDGDRP